MKIFRLKFAAIFLAIVAISIAVIISAPETIDFKKAIVNLPLPVIIAFIVAILLQLVGHWLRSLKHSLILNQVRPVKTIEIFKGQSIGYLFNSVLPFRIGELIRAHYIARGVSISRSAVFATIIFERFIDIGILLLLILPIIFLSLSGIVMTNISLILSIAATLTVSLIIIGFLLYAARTQQVWLLRFIHYISSLFNNAVKNRLRFMSWSAIFILKNAINKKNFYSYLLLSVVMWIFYLGSTVVLIWALLPGLTILTHWLVTEAAYMGISIPSGPAYLTTFQHIFTDVSGLDVSYLRQNSITLYVWFLLVIPVSLLGLIFLIAPQKKYADQKNDILSALKNKLFRDVDITNDFAHFLDAYFRGSEINKILTSEELSNNFNVIRTFRGGSSALTLLAWQDTKMVVKKITLKQYQSKLKAQFDWLKNYSKHKEIAQVISEKITTDHYSIDIEYNEEFIPFFDTIHSSSADKNTEILSRTLSFMDQNIYGKKKITRINKRLATQYIKTKAIEKIVDSSNLNSYISQLASYETLIVNNEEFDNFFQIIDKISRNKDIMRDIATIEESIIHGDLTVDNIIVNPKNSEFIILDPNNENSISDKVVDLGKMMQSLHSGYEFLVLLTSCDIYENQVTFNESKSVRYEQLYKSLINIMKSNLSEERFRTVLFHEAMHYCRMLPYRCDINPETAAVFYSIAVRLFNEFYKQYEK